MIEILHQILPQDMVAARALPGIQPVTGSWLHVDEAYGAQMARRVALLAAQRDDVLWSDASALEPSQELLEMVLTELPRFGFSVRGTEVLCPDGRLVHVRRDDPLGTLGQLVQCDFCLLDKVGNEHVLQGAVLCFPASWTLAEKAGRGLIGIHDPVQDYDDPLARRVQRLFDGVQVGRPLWRFNQLWYEDPELHQPRSAQAPRDRPDADAMFWRAERQTIFRLPKTNWAVFAIHTYVLRREDVEGQGLEIKG